MPGANIGRASGASEWLQVFLNCFSGMPGAETNPRSDSGRDLIAQKNRAGFTLPGGFGF
jgi:hypothetical protein